LLEAAHDPNCKLSNGIGQMPAEDPVNVQLIAIPCGNGATSISIAKTINDANSRYPFFHNSKHDYFVFDEIDRLTTPAQQSLKTAMDFKRCMFVYTTNYLHKVDLGIVNRCHLVEMNQATNTSAYIPIGQNVLCNMGLGSTVVSVDKLQAHAVETAQVDLDSLCADIAQAIDSGWIEIGLSANMRQRYAYYQSLQIYSNGQGVRTYALTGYQFPQGVTTEFTKLFQSS
jgi:hypothetical protein